MDYFLNSLGPSNESEQRRAFIFEKVKQIVHKAYGGADKVQVLKYGSDPLKTYLPDSDIDITVLPIAEPSGAKSAESSSQAVLPETPLN